MGLAPSKGALSEGCAGDNEAVDCFIWAGSALAVVADTAAVDGLEVRGRFVMGEETDLEVTMDADREGPSFDATSADLSMNRRYSYLDLMYCSSSLSRSVSSKFGGGGLRISFGLYIELDLELPMALILST